MGSAVRKINSHHVNNFLRLFVLLFDQILILTCVILICRHAHKSTVMDIKWNQNGNWVATASRDHLIKLYDIRNLNNDMQTFRGHKKETSVVAWHPQHEGLMCSGGSDGSILFWHVGWVNKFLSWFADGSLLVMIFRNFLKCFIELQKKWLLLIKLMTV